jgi:hypothetical protein
VHLVLGDLILESAFNEFQNQVYKDSDLFFWEK